MTVPLWAWGATFGVLAVLIAADLMLTRTAAGLRAAALLSAVWIAAAVAFGGTLWWWRGPAVAGQYFAGYLLEKALSVDNLFVFVVLFASLEVPAQLQRRVLHFGVLGALVLRGACIVAGGALIGRLSWIFYVFGGLVLLASARMFRPPKAAGPRTNLTVRALRRVLPVTPDYAGGRFFTRISGKTMVTPLFLALVAVEAADLVFALDSIPAVFGVTRDLLHSPVIELPVTVSLGAIVVVAAGAIAASMWSDRDGPRHEGPGESPRKAVVRG